ncbi:MAG: nicotinate-nucleotide--dimethylbenzimidazole phosphoribosyltransferase [Firmicutes bacterium]|nr:nicotinate-nucleotide--dimethylbenzimidazole phosphoribosyltransferase [Bacillota bacterium]
MELLTKAISEVGLPDDDAVARCKARLDSLTKPPGSLGMLEDVAVKIAGITGRIAPDLSSRVVLVMAGDHGVTAEGVSAYPSEVTPQMVLNFLRGGAAINVLARHAGAGVVVADVGVAADVAGEGLRNVKVRKGTANMAAGPAMSREEAVASVEAGIRLAHDAIDGGAAMIATGDMGIGNTTASSAILAAFSGMDVGEITGRGTGVDDARLRLKADVIRKALAVNRPDPADPLDVLHKVGGLEIGAIAGAIISAAGRRVPVVVDGFISSAGALVAERMQPNVRHFMVASHLSEEPGHGAILKIIGLEPMLHMRMRLGEGTGAVLAFHLIDASMKVLREMATFAEAGVSERST